MRFTAWVHRRSAVAIATGLALAAGFAPEDARALVVNGDYTVDEVTNTEPQVFDGIVVGDTTGGAVGVGTLTILDGRLVRSTTNATIALTVTPLRSATGTVEARGSASRLEVAGTLFIGQNGGISSQTADGFLNIGAGGRVRALQVILCPNAAPSSGTVTVSGPGALLEIVEDLELTQNLTTQFSTVTIGPGGAVSIGTTIDVFGGGTVILDGGTLSLTGPAAAPPAANLQYNSGTFRFRTSQTLDGGAGFYTDHFGSPPVLAAGRGLVIDGTTTLTTSLRIDGGSLRTERIVTVPGSGSLVVAGGRLTLTGEQFVIGDGAEVVAPPLTVGDGADAPALLELAGADEVLLGALTVAPDGAVIFGGERLSALSIDNSGSLTVADAALDTGSGLANTGSLRLIDAVVAGDVNSPAGSTIDVAGTVVFNGRVAGAAAFHGGGTAVFNGSVSID
jgi:hypothetical protein